MPPSGPTLLWSSNNSIQLNTSSHEKNERVNMMNNTTDDVIGSLGKVLSSVNIAGDVDGSGHSSHNSGGGGQGGYAVGSAPGSWSGLSGSAAAPAPAGLSYNFYNNNGGANNQPPNANENGNSDSLQNILYDSGIYEKEEVAHRRASTSHVPVPHSAPGSGHNTAGPSTPISNSERERKPSIDIFLSQSPSKALGEDAFRGIMHRTASNPSLVKAGVAHGSGNQHDYVGGSSGLKPLASTAPSSRSESPQNARSGGHYGNTGRQQQVHQQQVQYNPSQFNNAAAANNTFIPQGVSQQQPHQQQHGQLHSQLQQPQQQQPQQQGIQSQFSNSSSGNHVQGLVNTGHQQQPQQHLQQQPQQQQQQYMAMPVAQQQPQVFYMAVPAPDGKGQVLQPMQMMQMPGQSGALMMPMAAASNTTNQGVNDQGQGGGQGGMMLMQPLQGNNGMGNNTSNNTMYSQDNHQGANNNNNTTTNNNNNQYGQYGGNNNYQQQNNTGYNNQYQGKNNGMDNNSGYGGGQFQPNDQNNLDQVPTGSLSMLYSSPQRPPLRALLGNVRRLSRDQVGCRLLQQALDEDGPSAATAILNEGLTFWAEAMVDPFGNYLFQKILERITPEERVTLVSSVSTRLVNASLNLHGTRSVQKIVEVCAVDEENEADEDGSQDENNQEENDDAAKTSKKKGKKKETAAKILTDALKPSAARLCIDSHGNHAIQRILLKLPYQYTQFIFDAVAASVEDVARHRHGCCVIQRCLDSRHSAARTHLVSRIVEKSLELMQDAYGNYVVQYVLDVCGDDEVHAICESVISKVCLLAIQKFSSNVMEKCLERCTDKVREEYLEELNDSDRIRELMMDPFGNYVVQRALSVSTHAQAIRLVETMKPHLSSQNGGGIRNTAGGRRILGKICRRFPNFVLEGETFEDYDLNQVLARGHSPHHHQQGGGGGGRGGRQNQFGNYPHPGPSPNHRRNGRGRSHQHHHQHGNQHIPQYQQPPVGPPQQQQQHGAVGGHQLNVQQQDMSVMQTQYNPYLFPHSM